MVNYGVIIIMILLVIYTGFTSNKLLLSGSNLSNILMNMSSRIVIALGIAGCIITAGCDLSAGRMIGFGGCIAGTLLQKMDYSKKFFPKYGADEYFAGTAYLSLLICCSIWLCDRILYRLHACTAIYFHNGNDGSRIWN